MFNMKEVGQRLSVMRKNANLTQMGLANKLGISYQAVSNWERGIAMPDISNISPLAEALGVSVDDIIGNQKISAVVKGEELSEKLSIDEFNAVSPLLEPERNAELLESNVDYTVTKEYNGVTVTENDTTEVNVSSLCLTQEEIDSLMKKAAEEHSAAMLAILAKHASQNAIDDIFEMGVEHQNSAIVAILKNRVSEERVKIALNKAIENRSVALTAILMKK